MLDHLVNVDHGQADDDLEGSEEELEVAGREWKRMEERSLKEGFRSDAVFLPLLIFKSRKGHWINIRYGTGRGGAVQKRKHSRRVLIGDTQRASPGPSRLAD